MIPPEDYPVELNRRSSDRRVQGWVYGWMMICFVAGFIAGSAFG